MLHATQFLKRDFLRACERITQGRLTLEAPGQTNLTFGTGAPEAHLVIRNWVAADWIMARGELGLGEAYVAGYIDTPSLTALTSLIHQNADHLEPLQHGSALTSARIQALAALRPNRKLTRNIRRLMDPGNEFFQLVLDRGMNFSGAIFTDTSNDLEAAQDRKNDRIISKLTPDGDILDLGCDWGGFAERAARLGHGVTGYTPSHRKKGYAAARLDLLGDIRIGDFDAAQGRFANIVSIEQLARIPHAKWPAYFAQIKAALAPDGRAVLQSVTTADSLFDIMRNRKSFAKTYRAAGNTVASNAVIRKVAREAGLRVGNIFGFGSDYAATCHEWARRLHANAPRLGALGFDDMSLRAWRYYFATTAASFECGAADVIQVELRHA